MYRPVAIHSQKKTRRVFPTLLCCLSSFLFLCPLFSLYLLFFCLTLLPLSYNEGREERVTPSFPTPDVPRRWKVKRDLTGYRSWYGDLVFTVFGRGLRFFGETWCVLKRDKGGGDLWWYVCQVTTGK